MLDFITVDNCAMYESVTVLNMLLSESSALLGCLWSFSARADGSITYVTKLKFPSKAFLVLASRICEKTVSEKLVTLNLIAGHKQFHN